MTAMTAVKAFCAASILTLSSLAMAEGGGDRVYGRMMQENQQAMEQYALENGKAIPEVGVWGAMEPKTNVSTN